jgi:hypothetical protein
VRLLAQGTPAALGAIPWASPVMMFGSLQSSRVATLGLNPSNLEFEAARGVPLGEPFNRFETLDTLHLKHWSHAGKSEVERIWTACEFYFSRRPYDGWFRPLNKVVCGLGVSYYDAWSTACHLDLVPFATAEKWSSLTPETKEGLVSLGAPSLVATLAASEIRVLILNGASVVRAFQRLLEAPLDVREMATWSLRRSTSESVKGSAHTGRVSKIAGMDLGREILVLGYNHNIQSSFGVTTAVVAEIGKWVARQAKGALV